MAISGVCDSTSSSNMIQHAPQSRFYRELDEAANYNSDVEFENFLGMDPIFQLIGDPTLEKLMSIEPFLPSIENPEATVIGNDDVDFHDPIQFWPDVNEFLLPDTLCEQDHIGYSSNSIFPSSSTLTWDGNSANQHFVRDKTCLMEASEEELIDWDLIDWDAVILNLPNEPLEYVSSNTFIPVASTTIIPDTVMSGNEDNGMPQQSFDAQVIINEIVEQKQNPNLMGYDEISKYFCMPEKKAAKVMNVGLTGLKARCRVLGILRWPYREIKSMHTLISYKQKKMEGSGGVTERDEIRLLMEQKELMEKIPGTKLTEEMRKVRQASYKAKFMERRRQKRK